MPLFVKFRSLLCNLFSKLQMDKDLDQEIRAHLELLTDEHLRAGMSVEEAERAARLELGGIEQVKEQVRDQRIGNWLHSLLSDCRFALRQLRKSPGFTAVAVLTLALGIGANTAMFSLVSSVLFRPLPYHAPDELFSVSDFMPRQHSSLVLESDYYSWREQNHAFTDIAAYETGDTLTLTGTGEPERLRAARATFNLLDVLGVQPKLGRGFRDEEDRHGAAGVVLLSDGLWRDRFSANPAILGQSIQLDGDLYTVVGVLRPDFEFLDNSPADVIVPCALENRVMNDSRSMRIVRVVGRLRPGVSSSVAIADLDTINQTLVAGYPGGFANMFRGVKAEVVPLRERLLGKSRPALLVLSGAVAFVLLIACANIASLQLARAISREKEIAIRGALGAGKWRVIRQLLTENLLLALAGGLFGLFLATWLIHLLVQVSPTDVPHLSLARLDLSVLCFSFVAACLAGILFGMAPIFASARPNLVESLKEGGSQPGTGRIGRRSQRILVIAELAVALVLLAGSALFLKSFHRLASVSPGIDAQGVFTARISLPPNLYSTDAQQIAFFHQLVERAATVPGVTSAGLTSILPLQGSNSRAAVELEGRPPEPAGQAPAAEIIRVTPGYFRALRIPLLSGTLFDLHDPLGGSKLLVVNQSFVKRFFPEESPLGHRVLLAKEDYWTIAGVVADTKQFGLAAPTQPGAYVPYAAQASGEMTLVLRSNAEAQSLLPAVRSIVFSLDKNLPLYDILTMQDILHDQTASQRFSTLLLSAFAALAVLLACLGIYGVTAYGVSQRTREFGLRMALGAQRGNILRLVLRQAALLTLIGMGIGTGLSLALSKFVESMLFEVRPTDPLAFVFVPLLLLAVVLLACFIPARRASRVDPIIALRYE